MSACTSAGLDLLAPVGAFFQVSQPDAELRAGSPSAEADTCHLWSGQVHQNSGNNYVYNSNNFLLPKHYVCRPLSRL